LEIFNDEILVDEAREQAAPCTMMIRGSSAIVEGSFTPIVETLPPKMISDL